MTISPELLSAIVLGVGATFTWFIRMLKEDRDFWRDKYLRSVDVADTATELSEKRDPDHLSPKAANAAQRVIRRTRRG